MDQIKEDGFTQKIRNYNRCKLHRWSRAFCKYTNPSLLHSLEQVVGGIGLYYNANKTKFLCFKQQRAISILKLQIRSVHIPK